MASFLAYTPTGVTAPHESAAALMHSYTDSTRGLLTLLGDYWTTYYRDTVTLAQVSTGSVLVQAGVYSDMLQKALASNIFDIPTAQTKPFDLLIFKLSEAEYGDGTVSFPAGDISTIPYLTTSLFDSDVTLVKDTHFTIDNGKIVFTVDIFRDEYIRKYSNAITTQSDVAVLLWATPIAETTYELYKKYGRFLYGKAADSERYRWIVRSMMQYYTTAKTTANIQFILNTLYGIPYTRYPNETVLEIAYTDENLVDISTSITEHAYIRITTDKRTYFTYGNSTLDVAIGETVPQYTQLSHMHIVEDYLDRDKWWFDLKLNNGLQVTNLDSSVHPDTNDAINRLLKYNTVHIQLGVTDQTYATYRAQKEQLFAILKSGFPVYLYPFVDTFFWDYLEDMMYDWQEESTDYHSAGTGYLNPDTTHKAKDVVDVGLDDFTILDRYMWGKPSYSGVFYYNNNEFPESTRSWYHYDCKVEEQVLFFTFTFEDQFYYTKEYGRPIYDGSIEYGGLEEYKKYDYSAYTNKIDYNGLSNYDATPLTEHHFYNNTHSNKYNNLPSEELYTTWGYQAYDEFNTLRNVTELFLFSKVEPVLTDVFSVGHICYDGTADYNNAIYKDYDGTWRWDGNAGCYTYTTGTTRYNNRREFIVADNFYTTEDRVRYRPYLGRRVGPHVDVGNVCYNGDICYSKTGIQYNSEYTYASDIPYFSYVISQAYYNNVYDPNEGSMPTDDLDIPAVVEPDFKEYVEEDEHVATDVSVDAERDTYYYSGVCYNNDITYSQTFAIRYDSSHIHDSRYVYDTINLNPKYQNRHDIIDSEFAYSIALDDTVTYTIPEYLKPFLDEDLDPVIYEGKLYHGKNIFKYNRLHRYNKLSRHFIGYPGHVYDQPHKVSIYDIHEDLDTSNINSTFADTVDCSSWSDDLPTVTNIIVEFYDEVELPTNDFRLLGDWHNNSN